MWKRFCLSALFLSIVFFCGSWILIHLSDTWYSLERQRVQRSLLDRHRDFLKLESDWCDIYYTLQDQDTAGMIQRLTALYWPALIKDFSIETQLENHKVVIIIYPDVFQLSESIGNHGNQSPMGAYYGGTLHILSPDVWTESSQKINRFLSEGPLVHELAHFATDLKTNGRFPLWFSEGVSLYYEYKYLGIEWRPDLSEEANLVDYEQLKNHFQSLDKSVAYRRCFEIVRYLAEKDDEITLQHIMQLMAHGYNFEKALAASNASNASNASDASEHKLSP